MGANQSSSITNTTDVLQKNLTNIMNKRVNEASSNIGTVNTLRFVNKGTIRCKNIKIGQTINVDSNVRSSLASVNKSDVQSMLKSAVDQTAQQKQEAVSGFLSTAFNNQNQEANNIVKVKNIIETNLTDEVFQKCQNVIKNTNDGVVVNEGVIEGQPAEYDEKGNLIFPATPCESFDIGQNILVKAYVDCSMDAFNQAMLKSEAISDAVQKSEQEQKSKVGGISELVDSLFGGAAMIIILVILGIAIVGYLFKDQIMALISGESSNPVTNLKENLKDIKNTTTTEPVKQLINTIASTFHL
jgi:hypothetical protein